MKNKITKKDVMEALEIFRKADRKAEKKSKKPWWDGIIIHEDDLPEFEKLIGKKIL